MAVENWQETACLSIETGQVWYGLPPGRLSRLSILTQTRPDNLSSGESQWTDAFRLSPFQTRRLQSEQSWSRKSSSVSLLQQALSSVQLLCATSGLISVNFRLETWLQGLWCLWFDLGTQVSEKGVKHKSTHTSVDSESLMRPFHGFRNGINGIFRTCGMNKPYSIPQKTLQGYLVLNRKPKQSGPCNFATLQNPRLQFVSCLR